MQLDSRNLWVSLLFFVAVGCYFFRGAIFGEFADLSVVRDLTKALPIALLAFAVARRNGRVDLIVAALALSAVGDVAGEHRAFLWQVGFFMAAHLCYITAFWRERRAYNRTDTSLSAVLWVVLMTFAGVVIPYASTTAEMIAALLYVIVIGTMATMALCHRQPDRWIYCIAALLFCSSDAMIGYARFVEPFAGRGIAIMTTYFAAQYLFAMAALRRCTATR